MISFDSFYRKFKHVILYMASFFIEMFLFLLFLFLCSYFFLTIFTIQGNSMEPLIDNDSFIVVNRISIFLQDPEFGDVIIFQPLNPEKIKIDRLSCLILSSVQIEHNLWDCKTIPELYIKRVLGVPGDTISIEDGEVFRNGDRVKEPYILKKNSTRVLKGETKFVVPQGKYFVLGDNRKKSDDSRSHSRMWQDINGKIDPFVSQKNIFGYFMWQL